MPLKICNETFKSIIYKYFKSIIYFWKYHLILFKSIRRLKVSFTIHQGGHEGKLLLKWGRRTKKFEKPCCCGRPVARFWSLEWQNKFLGRRDFCFYRIFKTNFLGQENLAGSKRNLGDTAPKCAPVPTGLCSRPRVYKNHKY